VEDGQVGGSDLKMELEEIKQLKLPVIMKDTLGNVFYIECFYTYPDRWFGFILNSHFSLDHFKNHFYFKLDNNMMKKMILLPKEEEQEYMRQVNDWRMLIQL
jgi:hypothetical protein